VVIVEKFLNKDCGIMGLHAADILVLAFYLVGMVAIGIWSARKIKSSADFFLPRRFGKAMMIMFSFGTGTHSDQAVSVASKSYTNGLSGIWYQWLWLPVTPFYWLIAPVFRRFRAITTSDVFEARYNPSVAMLYAGVGVLNLAVNIGLMLKGSSAVISASTGGMIGENVAIIVMTVIFVAYGVAGGLGAAILTDFIQGVLTIIFSFLLLPLILNAVGGMSGLREAIADPEMFSLVAPAEIGFFYIAVIAFNGLVGIVTQPHTMANCAAGKTEMEGRVGFMFGTMVKRLCTVAWSLTGLAAVAYFAFAGRAMEGDEVFGAVAGDFLPNIMPGVLGIFIAAILASVMSSCDAFMISSSALFTENVYKRLVRNRGSGHYVTVGRITAVVIVAGGVGFAFWLPSVVKGLEIFWMISPMMGIVFWLGLFWRRTTVAGAWAATLTAFSIWFLTTLSPVVWLAGHTPISKDARFVFVKESKSSALIQDCHFKDAGSLARKLQEGDDALSLHIQSQLSEKTRSLLSEYDGSAPAPEDLRTRLLADINLLIQGKLENGQEDGEQDGGALYEESRFAHVSLPEKTLEMLSEEPEGRALVDLNRRLLEEAYPEEFSRSWAFCGCDIKKPVPLARRLNQAKDAVSLYVRERLSSETRKLIAHPESVTADELQKALAGEFNSIGAGENIYSKERFAKAFTTEKTIKLAKEEPSGEELVKLNNYLLEEAFIWEVSKERYIEIYFPWQMVFYLTGGTLMGIIVSLFTRPVAKEKLDNFYALIRTPVRPGEKVAAPCTLPEGAVVPEKRNIFPNTNFEISIPSLTSVVGFLIGWACVAAIIGSVYLIARA
jgi:Na+/proline symporter